MPRGVKRGGEEAGVGKKRARFYCRGSALKSGIEDGRRALLYEKISENKGHVSR